MAPKIFMQHWKHIDKIFRLQIMPWNLWKQKDDVSRMLCSIANSKEMGDVQKSSTIWSNDKPSALEITHRLTFYTDICTILFGTVQFWVTGNRALFLLSHPIFGFVVSGCFPTSLSCFRCFFFLLLLLLLCVRWHFVAAADNQFRIKEKSVYYSLMQL